MALEDSALNSDPKRFAAAQESILRRERENLNKYFQAGVKQEAQDTAAAFRAQIVEKNVLSGTYNLRTADGRLMRHVKNAVPKAKWFKDQWVTVEMVGTEPQIACLSTKGAGSGASPEGS